MPTIYCTTIVNRMSPIPRRLCDPVTIEHCGQYQNQGQAQVAIYEGVRESPAGLVFIGGVLFERHETAAYPRYTATTRASDRLLLAKTMAEQQSRGKKVVVQLCAFASVHVSASHYQPGIAVYTCRQIEDLELAFVEAAGICLDLGADGVELHATHGSFLNQYVSPHFNRRTDAFGIAERDFPLLQRLAAAIRDSHPGALVGIRLNGFESVRPGTQEVHPELIAALEAAEFGFLDVSSGLSATYKDGRLVFASHTRSGNTDVFPRNIASDTRRLRAAADLAARTRLPVLYAGGLATLAQAERVALEQPFAAIGFSRAFVSDPHFLTKTLQRGAGVAKECVYCNLCVHFPTSCPLWDSRLDGLTPRERRAAIAAMLASGPASMAESAAPAADDRDRQPSVRGATTPDSAAGGEP